MWMPEVTDQIRYLRYKRAENQIKKLAMEHDIEVTLRPPEWVGNYVWSHRYEMEAQFLKDVESGRALPKSKRMSHQEMVEVLVGGRDDGARTGRVERIEL